MQINHKNFRVIVQKMIDLNNNHQINNTIKILKKKNLIIIKRLLKNIVKIK